MSEVQQLLNKYGFISSAVLAGRWTKMVHVLGEPPRLAIVRLRSDEWEFEGSLTQFDTDEPRTGSYSLNGLSELESLLKQ